jgi:hypothetical protein
MNIWKKLTAVVAIASFSLCTNAAFLYTEDFNDGVADDFTGNTNVESFPSQTFLGMLSTGSANANSAFLTIDGLSGFGYNLLTISFDVYAFRSLDGGNDAFSLSFNGDNVFTDSFRLVKRAGGNNTHTGPTNGTFVSYDINDFGFLPAYVNNPGVSIYRYTKTFNSFGDAVSFGFIGNTDQSWYGTNWRDEGFGLDNVRITAVSAPATLGLFGLSLMLLGLAKRRRA